MSSFLGLKSRGAFEKPAFFLAGKLHDHCRFWKTGFLKRLSLFSKKIFRQCWSFKLEKRCLISINLKKTFKPILVCLFGERRRVQVTKFALEDFIFNLLCSAANSVGTTLEFAVFGSGPDVKYSRTSVFYCFFCPQPWLLRRSEQIFQGKHALVYRSSCDQWINSHINIKINAN